MPETMQITVKRADLTRAMALASTVVERRNTIPVLRTLKAVANGMLSFEGSNLDTFTRAEVPYTGTHAAFALCEPARVMAALNASGGETVAFGGSDPGTQRITFASGSMDGALATMFAEDHPGAELVGDEHWGVDLGAAELAQIARLMASISTEETRYYLNGVCVKKAPGDNQGWTWRFASTDGHRLTMVDLPLPGATGDLPDGLIIPRAFLRIALARFARSREPIRLSFGYKLLTNEPGVELDVTKRGMPRISLSTMLGPVRFTLATKLIDGTYPDYARVVPINPPFAARIAKADLVRAVNALSHMASEKTRAVKLSLNQGDTCTLSLNSPDLGEGRFTIPAQHNTKPGFWIGFNGRYLLDMCAALRGDEVQLALTDAAAPTLITDPADTAFVGLLMPMRV